MSEILTTLLAHRGILRIGGEDRRSFLQGLISNDIHACTPGKPIYAALLTPQGKFLHDMFITDTSEDFLVDCESARTEDLLKRLGMYKLRAKVTLTDARNEFEVWTAWNGHVAAMTEGYVYIDPRFASLGSRIIAKKNMKLIDGTKQTNESDYDKHRLQCGVADGSRDMIIEKSTLLEGNFDLLNGISWSKGCYTGQELTARTHYRGLVKKRLFPVKLTGGTPILGGVIEFNGEDIGDMRSSSGDLGLALLNTEKAQMAMREKRPLFSGSVQLHAFRTDWMKN